MVWAVVALACPFSSCKISRAALLEADAVAEESAQLGPFRVCKFAHVTLEQDVRMWSVWLDLTSVSMSCKADMYGRLASAEEWRKMHDAPRCIDGVQVGLRRRVVQQV
ncbi:hypothetical protein B296_00029339 [Ensete ventricosum]|uniref:Uncharacterized protein n=1 Tax=Ensete ventricosum TaxID=4639 RepID=A0A426ZVZ5_ENSVE|nr:hypothetical protein B296_00029339 [Ensete ventricosum]